MTKQVFVLAVVLLLSCRAMSQPADLFTPDAIEYPVHRDHIGQIAFMAQVIPIERFTSADFLTTFELKEKTDLNIRVFMGNALTNYLHRLAPEATAEQLVSNGNFQFVFWVDGVRAYTENLHHGAFGADNKNRKTVFRIPLISSTNEDSWGRFMWNRFMAHSGRDLLTSGEHQLKIEIRPYFKHTEVITGDLIATGNIQLIVPDVKIKEQLVKIQPIKPLKDWEINQNGLDTVKIEALNRKILTETFKDITSIVMIKDGQLLLEEYFNGASRKTQHDTRSVGKSFASAMLGIAIRDGYIKSENQPLSQFYQLSKYQSYTPAKENITLKQLLTMSAPLQGSDMDENTPGNEENMYPTPNWVEFTLNLPIDQAKLNTPVWDYFTAGVVVLGDVIHQSVPGGLEQYSDQTLFQPLGISTYKWQKTPQKVANTAGGLAMRSIDYAKFGQLYQNQGVWKGKQILPKDWVEKSFSRQIPVSEGEYYGYLFWNKTYQVNGRNFEVYYSSGNGGNKIMIFKDIPVVIVITSTAYNKPYGHTQADKIVQQYLIPAIVR